MSSHDWLVLGGLVVGAVVVFALLWWLRCDHRWIP